VLSLLSLVFSLASSVWPSVLAGLFPTQVRFTGLALSYNMSVTLLSGFAPLAATILIEQTRMDAAPALYIALCAALSFWCSFLVPGRARAAAAPEAARATLDASDMPPA